MRIILTALITTLLLGSAVPAGSSSDAIVVTGRATATEITLAEWGVDRFARAGLDLPATVVEFAEDPTACSGNTAVAVHGADTPRIIVCTDDDASGVVVRRTLLHELAHIWAQEALDATTTSAFLSLRGLDSWSDAETWSERGSEHAAEIITWALMDTELSMWTLADHDPAGMAAAYELLTGSVVPGR